MIPADDRLSQVLAGFLGLCVKEHRHAVLLEGTCLYLASTSELQVVTHDAAQPAGSPQAELVPASAAPLVALAFKLTEVRFGQLTYMRVCQGSLKEAQFNLHGQSGKRIKVPNFFRMHSNEMEVGASL